MTCMTSDVLREREQAPNTSLLFHISGIELQSPQSIQQAAWQVHLQPSRVSLWARARLSLFYKAAIKIKDLATKWSHNLSEQIGILETIAVSYSIQPGVNIRPYGNNTEWTLVCAPYIKQKTARNRFGNVSADVEGLNHFDWWAASHTLTPQTHFQLRYAKATQHKILLRRDKLFSSLMTEPHLLFS